MTAFPFLGELFFSGWFNGCGWGLWVMGWWFEPSD